MSESLRIRRGGSGEPVLLLLHGLGATGDVWRGLEALLPGRWPGQWITPDLPGHGGSAPLSDYTFERMAEAVAPSVPPRAWLAVLGHSLGGVIGLVLAGGQSGVRVSAVCGVGIKVAWTDEELARAQGLATRPNPAYSTRAEAVDRYLKVAGLVGLVTPDAVGDAAVVETPAGWSLAFDPKAFAVGAPEMHPLLHAAVGTVVLAAGARDPMCTEEQLRRVVPDPVILPGLGHNAHVEDSAALVPLLGRLAGARLS